MRDVRRCVCVSISSPAFLMARKAASTTASGPPTKVTTVLLVAFPGIHIQQLRTFHRLDLGSDLPDDVHISPLRKIGHTLYELLHAAKIRKKKGEWEGIRRGLGGEGGWGC